MPNHLSPGPFDLQGHRGARGLAPENTLPAFAKAMEIGVTTLELDTAVTRDGVIVVAHDRRLNPEITRDQNGIWIKAPPPAVFDMNAADLRSFDVGRIDPHSAYRRRFPHQQGMDGVSMPLLAEVFALVRAIGNNRMRFNIETKLSPLHPLESPSPEMFASLLLETVRAADLMDRVSIQSFDWRTLRCVRERAPEVAVSYLSSQQSPGATISPGAKSPWTDGIEWLAHGSVPRMIAAAATRTPASSALTWSPHFADLTPELIEQSHELGMAVLPWTPNSIEEISLVISLGVDGLITDYPDRARQCMAQAGLDLPPTAPVSGTIG